MSKFKTNFLFPIICALLVMPANANWQYNYQNTGRGVYTDDGSRFSLSFRGGLSSISAKITNELGSLVPGPYYVENATGLAMTEAYYILYIVPSDGFNPANYTSVGQIDIAELPAAKKIGTYSFATAVSAGWSLPNNPQWRLEVGWDHISESEYNQSPLFDGVVESSTGDMIHVLSGGVNSTMTTDIVSAMAYYDFFSGLVKPTNQLIPYIGFGAGYADTRTVLNLTDLYGDLSGDASMQEYGVYPGYGVLNYYQSKTTTANIAGVLAAGFSYGLDTDLFLDFGVRLTYLPQIKWALNNAENAAATSLKSKDIFSADGVMFTNVLLGIRFEF